MRLADCTDARCTSTYQELSVDKLEILSICLACLTKVACRCLNTEGMVNGTKEDKVDIYRRHKICIVMV